MDTAADQTGIARDAGTDASVFASRRGQTQGVKHSRGIGIFIVLLLIIAAALFLPWFSWKAAPELDLRVAVVDKTVPFEDRREHRGLFWALGQNKIVDPAKDGDSQFYDFRKDYVGYDPNYAPAVLRGGEEPPNPQTSLLDYSRDLLDRDVLYLADTYGVYDADYQQFEGEFAHTRHSQLKFGGLQEQEVEAAERFAADGKLIIAEFNTFASPTPKGLAERMEAILGVHWTRWIGRYFPDFSNTRDVPEWLYELYDGSAEWERRGRVDLVDEQEPAFVLTHDESPDFIFLWKSEDIKGSHAVTFSPVEKYIEQEVMQGTRPGPVSYWIELLEPLAGTEQLGTYVFNLEDSGKLKMQQHGLRLVWPAMTRYSPADSTGAPHTAYYLVGDMSDFDKAMGSPHTRLTQFINRSYYGKQAKIGSQEYMFWNGYYPFLCNVLRAESKRLTGEPENVYLFK